MELTKQDKEYIWSVDNFFNKEGLDSLSQGTMTCPDCFQINKEGNAYNNGDKCLDKDCNFDFKESLSESYFSWSPCDVCNRPEGGDRYDMVGYNPTTKEIQGGYSVCVDCTIYIANDDLPQSYQ